MTTARDTSTQRGEGGRLVLSGAANGTAAAFGDAPSASDTAARRTGAHRVALMRIGFGLIWAIDAWYKWQPAFLSGFADEVSRPVRGGPAWVSPWLKFWQNLITPHATFFAVCTALLETVLAAGLILGLGRRSLYAMGAVFSFLIWAVPESFGRFWESGQTDLGTSIIYVLIFIALLLVDAGANVAGWSLDRRLVARLRWWRHVSEL